MKSLKETYNELNESTEIVKKDFKMGSGHIWQVKLEDNSKLISYSYSWSAYNDGTAFSKNYKQADVIISATYRDAVNDKTIVLIDEQSIGKAKYKKDADKLARKWIKDNIKSELKNWIKKYQNGPE